MNIKSILTALLLTMSFSTQAQMHKCLIFGKITYQESACPEGTEQAISTEGVSVVPGTRSRHREIPRSVTNSTHQRRATTHQEGPRSGQSAWVESDSQCERWVKRVRVIDARARRNSTEKLAEERRELMVKIWRHKCELL